MRGQRAGLGARHSDDGQTVSEHQQLIMGVSVDVSVLLVQPIRLADKVGDRQNPSHPRRCCCQWAGWGFSVLELDQLDAVVGEGERQNFNQRT